jgi:glyoxylase-like metal-dependent hydrolase (beta-lactamase superfamily II)
MPSEANVKVREVHPGVYLVPLPLPMRPRIVNVFLIRGGDEWALVDTGMNTPDSISTFRAALDAVGCPPERLATILCTHHHPDHFGAAKPFKDLTGATVRLHEAEYARSYIVSLKERRPMMLKYFLSIGIPMERMGHVPAPGEIWASLYAPVPPDLPLNDGDVIRVGDRELNVVWTPGHAPGHCVFHLPRERLLIAGDHLLPKITPHVGYLPGGAENPLGDFLDSQRKVQRLDVDLVLPAHGGVFGDHRHRASQIIQHHHARLQETLDVVRRRPRLPYDAARRVFGFALDSSIMVQFPATFETLAHLEYLRHEGKVVRQEVDGLTWYSAP